MIIPEDKRTFPPHISCLEVAKSSLEVTACQETTFFHDYTKPVTGLIPLRLGSKGPCCPKSGHLKKTGLLLVKKEQGLGVNAGMSCLLPRSVLKHVPHIFYTVSGGRVDI